MPRVENVEKRIFDIEGFEAKILSPDGKDVRGDASLPKQYEANRMTRNNLSVNDWKEKFKTQYPGYDVEVLKGNGNKAAGQTKLSTVRDTYIDDDN